MAKEITNENAPILYALALMWNQYCPPNVGHMFMTAGEQAEITLQEYGLIKDGKAEDEYLEENFDVFR